MPIVVMIPSDLGAARAGARAELLEPVLAKMLQANVEVRVAASYREILDAIVGGTVDLAWAPPTVCARSAASAVFFAGVERGGRRSYRAAVLGASATLPAGALRGAWVDPLSAAGCVLARTWLARVHSRSVTDAFLGSYMNAAEQVVQGGADVCSVYTVARDEATARAELPSVLGVLARRLFVLGLTAHAPTDAWIVTQKPDAARRAQLVQALTTHVPTALLDACDGDALVPTSHAEYEPLASEP